MSSDVAISVRGLGKTYSVASTASRATTLGELLSSTWRRPFSRRPRAERFDALNDVSFEVRTGSVLGIIGRNGAGKSTLLKILSQITAPTRGEVDLRGRVGSLLEVGTGFHPELTGRENIYLNGAILGMSRREIQREFDSIVAFAGTERFLDMPVKRYSSGMYVRLAFAVAAHLCPDILIVDEVLAVGDAEFQRKCIGKMGEIATQSGRTVLFVSHSMPAIQQLCTECLLLDRGTIIARGSPREITELYLRDRAKPGDVELSNAGAPCKVTLVFVSKTGEPTTVWAYGEPLHLRVTIDPLTELWKPSVDLAFYDPARARLFVLQSDRLPNSPERISERWELSFRVENPGLVVSEISVDVGVRQAAGEYVALFCDAARLGVDLGSAKELPAPGSLLYPVVEGGWSKAL